MSVVAVSLKKKKNRGPESEKGLEVMKEEVQKELKNHEHRLSIFLSVLYVLFRSGHRVLIVFFFFQAEDGIRDFHVTGVQTCALPISRATASARGSPPCSRKIAA